MARLSPIQEPGQCFRLFSRVINFNMSCYSVAQLGKRKTPPSSNSLFELKAEEVPHEEFDDEHSESGEYQFQGSGILSPWTIHS